MQINQKWLWSKSLLLILILSVPMLESLLVPQRERYFFHPEFLRNLDYVGMEIFSKKPPIDFLFIGPSSLWSSVDASIIEKYLREENKNPSIHVENFGHIEIGIELDYFILKDLVEHRGVKTIFLGTTPIRQKNTHRYIRYIWDPIRHAGDTGMRNYATLYAEKILDSFPNLVRHFFLPPKYHPGIMGYLDNLNGSLVHEKGFSNGSENIMYERIDQEPLKLELKDVLHEPSDPVFHKIGDYTEYQEHFFRKILELAKDHGIDVFLFVPPIMVEDVGMTGIQLMTFQNGERIPGKYIGVPMATLFPGKDIQYTKKFYYDQRHTNRNGSGYFTRSLLKPLQEIYAQKNR